MVEIGLLDTVVTKEEEEERQRKQKTKEDQELLGEVEQELRGAIYVPDDPTILLTQTARYLAESTRKRDISVRDSQGRLIDRDRLRDKFVTSIEGHMCEIEAMNRRVSSPNIKQRG